MGKQDENTISRRILIVISLIILLFCFGKLSRQEYREEQYAHRVQQAERIAAMEATSLGYEYLSEEWCEYVNEAINNVEYETKKNE
jgi:hypothetical protein